jgi:hypothetical protein
MLVRCALRAPAERGRVLAVWLRTGGRMSIADFIEPSDPDKPDRVELVTMPETLTQGIVTGNPRPFPDMASALAYADTLPKDERDISFIRTREGAMTLADARKSIAQGAAGAGRKDGEAPA